MLEDNIIYHFEFSLRCREGIIEHISNKFYNAIINDC